VTAASGLVLSFVALLGGVLALAVAMFVVSFSAAAAWLYLYRDSPQGKEWMRRGAILREAEQQWKRAHSELLGQLRHFTDDFDRKRAALISAKNQLGQLEKAKQRQLSEMQRQAQARQYAEYMDGFNIADADIPNIGKSRAAMLAYHGIETARDVADASTLMAIPGFGESLANSLVAWRHRLATQFNFNAAKGLPLADIQAVTLKFGQQRMNLEASLLRGEAELRRISLAAKKELDPFQARVLALKQQLEQARVDLRAM
jgi:DNA-binding helix-hairpin-helix protein with protein kinase domain